MSFVSGEFAAFLAVFFVAYHMLPTIKQQNLLIVIGSYIFYGWWDWRFLPLLFGISFINYLSALLIANGPEQRRKPILVGAVAVSLLVLAVFKYYGFFVSSFVAAMNGLGLAVHASTLHIILPLGISFMTFQGMAYVIDVYRGDHPPERDFIAFLGFKAFFPQLVAGPIERASHLLDQFHRERSLDANKASQAIVLLIYGYALKCIVADGMAPIVDSVFVPTQAYGWSTVLGTLAFGIQIYADFCGYSLIAKGAALLLGFELIWNFRFPYWAVSIGDFWQRWHISLSRWLRDYLYIPLGGNRHGPFFTARNLLVTMILGGLWHGANWNFVFWGLLHGTALTLWRFLGGSRTPDTGTGRIVGWAATMAVVFAGWFLFRATSYDLLTAMTAALANWEWAPVHTAMLRAVVAVALPLVVFEWLQRAYGDFFLLTIPRWVAYPVLSVFAFLALAMSRHYQATFIYFQF